MAIPLLSIENLCARFNTVRGEARAVDHVSLDLAQGRTLAVVGESGCGKTALALAVMGLLRRPGEIVSGAVRFKGRNLLSLPKKERRALLGEHMAMVFQEPMTALNPVLTIGEQIAEIFRARRGASRAEARRRAQDMLTSVGFTDPAGRFAAYPHELSGGMRQRVMIAMALCLSPELLIADEPTTALDAAVQNQVLALMLSLARERRASVVLITHNLNMAAAHCDAAAVMYAGSVVEYADAATLFSRPAHPYTAGLLACLPKWGPGGVSREKLRPIPGTPPSMTALPSGCRFHPRCPKAFDACSRQTPPLLDLEKNRRARCLLYA